MHAQIPNALTVLRIILALTGAMGLWLSYSWHQTASVPSWMGDPATAARGLGAYSVAAFAIAAVSDWLDGWLARRWALESRLGAFLDPIADKLLVNGYLLAYLMILSPGDQLGGLPPDLAVPVIAIILRDIVVTALRTGGRPGETLPVSLAAKIKTSLAIGVAGFPLLAFLLGWQDTGWVFTAWIVAVWLTSALSLWTGFAYLTRGRRN
jgi:CDP-diacylglycerol--glycerol-3-phosphate 3-phosphatidyltransferase